MKTFEEQVNVERILNEVVIARTITVIMGYLEENLSKIIAAGIAEYKRNEKPVSDELTLRQAYKEFGEAWVKKMLKEGYVKKVRTGGCINSPFRLSKSELLAAKCLQLENPREFVLGRLKHLNS